MMLEEGVPSKVVFGTGTDRKCYPTDVAKTRFGNEMNPIKGEPNTGPGCYNTEEVSNLIYQVNTKVVSKKGYTLGARTAPRFFATATMITPAPTEYQTHTSEPRPANPAFRPFLSAASRFHTSSHGEEENTPGPGNYDFGTYKHKQVTWHQSFGSQPINLPCLIQRSTIDANTDKLMSAKEEKRYQRRLAYLKLYYEKC